MQPDTPSLDPTEDGCGEDVCGLKYISHQHNFIYFEVPKTGTSSLLSFLKNLGTIEQMQGQYDFLNYPDYHRLAFVRNPWDRVLSCYRNKIKQDSNFQSKYFANGVMKKFHRFNVFYAGMPFREFVQAVAKIPDRIADGHFASQYTRLFQNNKLVITHLARFENYRDEVELFLKKVGIETDLKFPHLNQTARGNTYAEYYNAETIRLVEDRYSEDIDRFGYRFNGE